LLGIVFRKNIVERHERSSLNHGARLHLSECKAFLKIFLFLFFLKEMGLVRYTHSLSLFVYQMQEYYKILLMITIVYQMNGILMEQSLVKFS